MKRRKPGLIQCLITIVSGLVSMIITWLVLALCCSVYFKINPDELPEDPPIPKAVPVEIQYPE